MASIVMNQIKSHHDLELLINDLPEELLNVEDKDLGNPEIMSPKAIDNWITNQKLNK
jgi:hypothetical protein